MPYMHPSVRAHDCLRFRLSTFYAICEVSSTRAKSNLPSRSVLLLPLFFVYHIVLCEGRKKDADAGLVGPVL